MPAAELTFATLRRVATTLYVGSDASCNASDRPIPEEHPVITTTLGCGAASDMLRNSLGTVPVLDQGQLDNASTGGMQRR